MTSSDIFQKVFFTLISSSFIKIAYLLLSGFFSSLVILAISLNIWQPFNREGDSNLFLMSLVLHGFLLTILKLGSDTYVFSRVRQDRSLNCKFSANFKKITFFLSGVLLVVSIVFFNFSGFQSSLLVLSALTDVFSLRNSAHLSARERYGFLMLSNISNYFLFFVCIIILDTFASVNLNVALVIFVISSLFRLAVSGLFLNCSSPNQYSNIFLINVSPFLLLLQQLLNYLLAKSDQILISSKLFEMDSRSLSSFFSITKSLDIFVAIQLSLLPLIISRLYEYLGTCRRIFVLYFTVFGPFLGVYFLFFLHFDIYSDMNRYLSIFFVAMNVTLSLFVNVFTYGFMKEDRISELIFILFCSSSVVLVFLFCVAEFYYRDYLIYCCVPMGQMLFVFLGYRRLYNV